MSLAHTPDRLQLPQALEHQLHDFRRLVWTVKIVEAVAGACFGILAAYLVLFGLDRLWDTPMPLRAALFVLAALGCANIPVFLHRWVWRNRQMEQLARLLSRRYPRVGDQLLGIIELAQNVFEPARSPELCEAAIREVARDAGKVNFQVAVPHPRHRIWLALAGVPLVVAMVLLAMFPAAAVNAWQRFLAPWGGTPRYTFTALEKLPDRLVVAHGEPFKVDMKLKDGTAWRPEKGVAQLGAQQPVAASLVENRYDFELPPQIDAAQLHVKIGDASQNVRVEPTLRPELTSIVASAELPQYLGIATPQTKDVRGGAISLVQGSKATFKATVSRDLNAAKVDGKPVTPAGATVSSPPESIQSSRKIEFRWEDKLGLEGKEPFSLDVTAREDEAPSLTTEDLPRQKVVLDTEQLSFKVRAQDDFGIKHVGLDWQGVESAVEGKPAKGERIIAAGGNEKDSLELPGTFSAKGLGIEPQAVNVRIFVEDYKPGRGRVYSPTYTFWVLNAEQHAIWVTEQLSKWHRQALLVRDREMQLFETNKQLRDLKGEDLDQPENRRRVENQAMAERANSRQLSGLVLSGEDLIKQAMRNPEFGIAHLEKWAEMLQILKDIAGNQMPSVADLLREAAQSPALASKTSKSNNRSMVAGNVRSGSKPVPSEPKADEKPKPPSGIPSIADKESSQQPPDEKGQQPPPSKSGAKTPRLTFPKTTLDGKPSTKKQEEPPAAEEQIEEAVKQQQDLLAEFEKIADELNRVLASLEGSTLLKRLKAASR